MVTGLPQFTGPSNISEDCTTSKQHPILSQMEVNLISFSLMILVEKHGFISYMKNLKL